MAETQLSDAQRRLLQDFDAGRRTALARVISLVEDGRAGAPRLLDALHARTGRAHRIGITGPPGAGKSTLAAGLITRYRARGETVGVLAVDPSSPFTGGAVLGDRIRMNDVSTDAGVFIRSMASRGSGGGLAAAAADALEVMDAFGFARLLIETVGVGQSELDIAAAADSTVVVLVPESGDGIQAMKAGLMEIADLFVVNKADRPGAERVARAISMMLHMRPERGWQIPVLQTRAGSSDGVDELVAALDRHGAWLRDSGELARRRRTRLAERVRDAVTRQLSELTWTQKGGEAILEKSLAALEAGEASPQEVAARIVQAAMG